MNTKMDLAVNNYTIEELFLVLEVNEFDSSNLILAKTEQYITRFVEEENILFIDFFQKVKTRLSEYFENGEQEDEENNGDDEPSIYINDEEHNDYLKDNLLIPRNDTNNEKISEIKISQGNPNLKNTISRMLVVDSQFRQVYNDENPSSPSDFNMDLSEPLNDLINIRLFSVQIPYTWYTIDEEIGTNFFYIDDKKIVVEPGNYKPNELAEVINETLQKEAINVELRYNRNNGKMTIKYSSNNVIEYKFTFFDFTRFLNAKTNSNLGFLMGFQKMEYALDANNLNIKGEAIVDLYGPKYLLIILDDFNQNHVNSGLINIYDNPNVSLKMPSYFNTTIPTTNNNNTTQFLPESPRQMTQSQLYALNQIQENKDTFSSNFRANAPVTTDVFAFMPIKHGETGHPFVEFGGSLQSNVRNYFGPVNINRLRIRLMDDKGNIVNLNGANWSFGIICETLYQY
jgi:hypothetical protein